MSAVLIMDRGTILSKEHKEKIEELKKRYQTDLCLEILDSNMTRNELGEVISGILGCGECEDFMVLHNLPAFIVAAIVYDIAYFKLEIPIYMFHQFPESNLELLNITY